MDKNAWSVHKINTMIQITRFVKLVLEARWRIRMDNASAPKILSGPVLLVLSVISQNTLILIPRSVSVALSTKCITCRHKFALIAPMRLLFLMVNSVWHAQIINTTTNNTKLVKTVREARYWIKILWNVNALMADFGLAPNVLNASIPNILILITSNAWAVLQTKPTTCWQKNVNIAQPRLLSLMETTVKLAQLGHTLR